MERTYKGYTIVKQTVGPCGWNIVAPDGSIRPGFRTLKSAKEAISWMVDE